MPSTMCAAIVRRRALEHESSRRRSARICLFQAHLSRTKWRRTSCRLATRRPHGPDVRRPGSPRFDRRAFPSGERSSSPRSQRAVTSLIMLISRTLACALSVTPDRPPIPCAMRPISDVRSGTEFGGGFASSSRGGAKAPGLECGRWHQEDGQRTSRLPVAWAQDTIALGIHARSGARSRARGRHRPAPQPSPSRIS